MVFIKIVKQIGFFLWAGILFKINREQLYLLSVKQGELDLICIDAKAKVLMLRNMYKNRISRETKIIQNYLN